MGPVLVLFYLYWRIFCCSMVGLVAFNSPLRAPALTKLMGSGGSPEPGRLKAVQERIFCKLLFVK